MMINTVYAKNEYFFFEENVNKKEKAISRM